MLADLTTMTVEEQLAGIEGTTEVMFTFDGAGLLLQDGRDRVLLYSLEDRAEIGFLLGQSSAGSGLFSVPVPTSDAVWVPTSDSWAEVPLDPDVWVARACELAGRELTQQEWAEFVPGDEPFREICTEDRS